MICVNWLWAEGGAHKWCDETWETLSGGSPNEHTADDWLAHVHESDRERVRAAWAAARESAELDVSYRLRGRDGEHEVHTHARLIRVPGLTERKWLGTHLVRATNAATPEPSDSLAPRPDELGQFLELTQKATHIGHWTFDIASGRVHWSDELFRIMDLPVSDSPPNYEEQLPLFTSDSWTRLEAAITNTVDTGEGYNILLDVVRPDGEHRSAIANATAERDQNGKVHRLIGTFHDVTELVRLQEANAQVRADLERTNEDLKRFAYAASHDLQEPLRAMAGCAGLLQARLGDKLDGKDTLLLTRSSMARHG